MKTIFKLEIFLQFQVCCITKTMKKDHKLTLFIITFVSFIGTSREKGNIFFENKIILRWIFLPFWRNF